MVIAPNKKITPAEYLAQENQTEDRTELIEGELFPMGGASLNHNRLTNKLSALLSIALEDLDFEIFTSDMRVWLEVVASYVYPDLVVVKGAPICTDDRQMELTNPRFIAEVLSPSTARYDKKAKFDLYKTLPTLQEYLILPQTNEPVELYRRLNPNQWLITELEIKDTIVTLESLNLEISLPELYKKIVF